MLALTTFLTSLPCKSGSESSHLTNVRLVKYWQIFFDIQYFMLLSPFRIKKRGGTTSTFEAVSWLPQKLFCGFCTCTTCFWMLFWLRGDFPKHPNNPSEYLQLVTEMFITLLELSLIRICWMRQQDIIKIVNFISHCNDLPILLRTTVLLRPEVQLLLFCWYFSFYALSIGWLFLDQNGIYKWEVRDKLGRSVFLFADVIPGILPEELSRSVEIIFHAVTVLSEFSWSMSYSRKPMVILMPLLTLWTMTKSFVNEISVKNKTSLDIPTFPVQDGYHGSHPHRLKYKALKKLSQKINNVFGFTCSCFLLQSIFYYATTLDEYFILEIKDILHVFNLVYLFLNFIAICTSLYLTGDICKLVSRFTHAHKNGI